VYEYLIFDNTRCELDNIDPIAWICTRISFCLILARLFNSKVEPNGRVIDCIAYCGQVGRIDLALTD